MESAPPPYSHVQAPPPINPGYPNPTAQPYPPPQQGYPPAPQQGYPPAPQQGYPPQQQQGYPPQQQQPYQCQPQLQVGYPTQAQPQKVVTVVSSLGSAPQRINCVNCRTEQVTKTTKRLGTMNWIVCGITALVILILSTIFVLPILFLPFALVALCIPSLMDTAHVCPNCNHLTGVHRVA